MSDNAIETMEKLEMWRGAISSLQGVIRRLQRAPALQWDPAGEPPVFWNCQLLGHVHYQIRHRGDCSYMVGGYSFTDNLRRFATLRKAQNHCQQDFNRWWRKMNKLPRPGERAVKSADICTKKETRHE